MNIPNEAVEEKTVSRNIIYPARTMSDPENDPGFRILLWSDGSVTWQNEAAHGDD